MMIVSSGFLMHEESGKNTINAPCGNGMVFSLKLGSEN